MIKVSVILPSLNVADYIEECIRSAMNQTLKNLEIISVDAGSEDGTVEILKKCEQEDSRIKLLTSGLKSYGKQVNMGIEAAKGEYIAILETDDFVDLHMYEDLYNVAKKNNADFVLADFDRFFENEKGIRERITINTWKDNPEIYGKILKAKELSELYHINPNLWRGIYKKKFIVNNNIRLNETFGAAYQDICYMHRVIMHAKRALFVPESYYRYRIDREGSSVNSVKGLQYSYQEYKLLLEKSEVVKGYESRIFCLMAISFIREIIQINPRMTKNWKEDNIVYYIWFKAQLLDSIKKGFVNEKLLGIYNWRKLKLLLSSFDDFLFTIKYPGNTASILQKIGNVGIIIFGAGKLGHFLFDKLKDIVSIDAFCDNKKSLWNTEIKGKLILSLEKCLINYPDNTYLIAINNHSELIERQLIEMGIPENKIFKYMP
ncbi:MAG: hypothetical protein H6Q69_283 [Firmicutes bacterium]|nr:hypothetical protein [Bacillota bacterium]